MSPGAAAGLTGRRRGHLACRADRSHVVCTDMAQQCGSAQGGRAWRGVASLHPPPRTHSSLHSHGPAPPRARRLPSPPRPRDASVCSAALPRAASSCPCCQRRASTAVNGRDGTTQGTPHTQGRAASGGVGWGRHMRAHARRGRPLPLCARAARRHTVGVPCPPCPRPRPALHTYPLPPSLPHSPTRHILPSVCVCGWMAGSGVHASRPGHVAGQRYHHGCW